MYSLLVLSLAMAAESEPASGRVSVGVGLVSAAQVDVGYSPLAYSGLLRSVGAAYERSGRRWDTHVALEYAGGPLRNPQGRRLVANSVSWMVLSLHHGERDSGFAWGWAQNNQFDTRFIDDFLNYNGRTHYFSSVGPAARGATSFHLLGQDFDVRVTGHLQLLGFYLPSGFVSSQPRGFGYEGLGFGAALFRSLFLFYPGSALNFGLRPELRWSVSDNAALGLSWSYDHVALRHLHAARHSRGRLGLSLDVGL